MNYGMNILGNRNGAMLIAEPLIFIGEIVAELPGFRDRKMRQSLDAIPRPIVTN
jgi:hypothetical protein